MTNKKTHAAKTGAAQTAIGFDYQYYYFLLRVLKLKKDESVGLEVKDDVHSELAASKQILIQLKHTVKKNSDGSPINLTNYDTDLWKTLSNWSKIISDKNDGRSSPRDQELFLQKTEFMLVSNKSQTDSCSVFKILNDNTEARKQLMALKDGTGHKTIKGYIQDILELDDTVLILFLDRIRLELEVDDIIQKCKTALEEHHIDIKRVERLFRNLDSQIKQDNFIKIKNGTEIVITFQEFTKKYRRFFDIARNTDLQIRQYHKPLPESLNTQIFIRQLLDIEEIKESDVEEIAEYTRSMLTVKTNLDTWIVNGELTSYEVETFSKDAKLRWRNKFKSTYRATHKKSNPKALSLLDEMRSHLLSLSSQKFDTEFSNGKFYLLSDIPEIGWSYDWENCYK